MLAIFVSFVKILCLFYTMFDKVFQNLKTIYKVKIFL